MKFNPLGNSDIMVSEICLGTMTWGSQNSQQDADAQFVALGFQFLQLDKALDRKQRYDTGFFSSVVR